MIDTAEMSGPEKPLLLIVDDDPIITDTLTVSLDSAFEIVTSPSRPHCRQLLGQLRRTPDLALVDLGLPPTPHRPDEGFALIGELLQAAPSIRIIVLSGQNDEDNARHARTLGAADFAGKPCDPGRLLQLLRRSQDFSAFDTQLDVQCAASGGAPLLGDSAAIRKLRLQVRQYADLPFPVLIEGESGSGKEIVASTCLHHETRRHNKPFFALNCAAIAPSLVEPTLFGYAKGAFTGAHAAKPGYFEDAADGTLFLDEIGELPSELQAKLLRVLENGEYQRVGETQKRISRARIIAATNRDLRQEVRNGRFRADLYYRLSVFSITAPPLREMGTDRLLLLEHFSRRYAAQSGQPPFTLTTEARALWLAYSFPGNVRELRNIVIRLTAKHPGATVDHLALADELDLHADEDDSQPLPSRHLPAEPACALAAATNSDDDPTTMIAAATQRLQRPEAFRLDRLLAETEQSYIEAALRLTHGNVSQAARLLGINRSTLYNRMTTFSDRDNKAFGDGGA